MVQTTPMTPYKNNNIPLLYMIKAFKWFMLYMPIIYLFYNENGFAVSELFLLHAIYSAIIAFFEVPSGYIADMWGRKKAIVLGSFCGALGFAAYSVSYGLGGFIIAEVFLGIGQSLISGADSAMLYDTLLERREEKKYLKTEGRMAAIGNLSESLAGIVVSLVVFSTYRTYYFLQTGLAVFAWLTALFLIEPQVHGKKMKSGIKEILYILNHSLRTNTALRDFILLAALIGFASLSTAWFAQPIFKAVQLPANWYGYAWVALNTLVALGSITSAGIHKKLKTNGSLLFMSLPLSLGFISLTFFSDYLIAMPLLILFYVRGTAHPILKNEINKLSASSHRATILSIRSLLTRILFFTLGPVLGYLTDAISLNAALALTGLLLVISAVSLSIMIILSIKKVIPE